ncbi:hypothetical protein FNL37_0007 [Methylovorus glucosotrophus]|uniref:DUF6776 family protein n=1 Tax=Methylovorus glucosotrophus TaxID=266009 RepID=UPI0013318DAF|nr:DUF6776 family protein [Methylovorus glucosotrophus]KAF0842600.1 hypothetical protein FNL37_0007 [Methylovorus glucosotrophus]
MRSVKRKLRRHFGATAHRVAVRAHLAWYWLPLTALVALVVGYGAAYVQFAGSQVRGIHQKLADVDARNQVMQFKLVQAERQLQVERAAQANLSRELDSVQAESMRLKEDIGFYQNIFSERKALREIRLHTFKVNKALGNGDYDYHILLMQAGNHDKVVDGSLTLTLYGAPAGGVEPQAISLQGNPNLKQNLSFKYYQQVDGKFSLPANVKSGYLLLEFVEKGATRANISEKVEIPAQ